jgi:4-deoxy-L-threo-5-hexosulose-uronate ketol-isomerase
MKLSQMADPVRFRTMCTEELRSTFLLQGLFAPGEINLAYVDADRAVIGGACPADSPLLLPVPDELRAEHFLDRREIGILNLGGPGRVVVDGESFAVGRLGCVYAGKGVASVAFHSDDASIPAAFYLLSYPAHAAYPTAAARFEDLEGLPLGAPETCNVRTIYKAIHADGIRSCQLVMGFTLLTSGSNWNTMPPHTHMRRSEVYVYFDLDQDSKVFHLMGPPDQTRHLVVGDREAVVSPGWSIHSGVGTRNYGFCWGMGGENQAYNDMDPAPVSSLR